MMSGLSNFKTEVDRSTVFKCISEERDYQDSGRGNAETDRQSNTIAEEILMIENYAAIARAEWCGAHPLGREKSLHTVRKIAALAVRCMEAHGAPTREQ